IYYKDDHNDKLCQIIDHLTGLIIYPVRCCNTPMLRKSMQMAKSITIYRPGNYCL
ncbi:unnamed protein product, partial [Musa hybrid cultivar]